MKIDFSQPLALEELAPTSPFDTHVIEFLRHWYSNEKTLSVQTSGSTGSPKVFDIEKEKMLNSARMTGNFLHLTPGDTALLCLPVEYISGKMMVVRAILFKMKLITSTPSVQALAHLNEPVDFAALTPLQVENSLDKIPLIKKLIIGGAAVSNRLQSQLKGLPTEVYETYGMSETLSHIALKQLNPKAESYFQLFEGISIGKDHRGCLTIDAPQLNNETLYTNDLVEIKDAHQFKFIGRTDNIINSGGAKISPEELEAYLKGKIPNEAVFIGLEDYMLGEKLVLVIEGENDERMKQFLFHLPYKKSFHKPREIIFVSEIPRTANGKLDRRALKKLLE